MSNKSINSGSQKRRFALLLATGYVQRWADKAHIRRGFSGHYIYG